MKSPSRVWGRHAPTRSCPKGAGIFQELKICGHGTILALMDNRKTRTVSLIQPTVLVFLVIRSKYCFMEPLPLRCFYFLVPRAGHAPLYIHHFIFLDMIDDLFDFITCLSTTYTNNFCMSLGKWNVPIE